MNKQFYVDDNSLFLDDSGHDTKEWFNEHKNNVNHKLWTSLGDFGQTMLFTTVIQTANAGIYLGRKVFQ